MDLNIAGIYRIINIINGKSYIGQSLNIKQRWANHKNIRGDCHLLVNAMRKYGIQNFKFEILETLDKNNNLFIEDDLNRLEIFYIEKYHTFKDDPLCNGYNMTTGGDRPVKMSEEARQRAVDGMKKYWSTPEAREKARKSRLGKGGGNYCWSEERKKHFSESKKGKLLPLTDKDKQRSIESNRLRGQKLYEHLWGLIKDFDKSKYGWTVEAAKQTGLTCRTIRRVCLKMGIPVKAPKIIKEKQIKTSIIYQHWELIKDIDKSKRGWIKEAILKTGLTRNQIIKTCEKLKIKYKTARTALHQVGEEDNRMEILSIYDKSKHHWVVDAMKDTGLSYQQIIYFCKKHNIPCNRSCPEHLRVSSPYWTGESK